MSYEILLTEQAVKDLEKMDSSDEERVRKRIKRLSDHPEHYGKPLKGKQPLWVLKVGRSDWRVIYKVRKEEEKIIILAIGHRRNVYKSFP